MVMKKRKTDTGEGASKPEEKMENVATHKKTLDELMLVHLQELAEVHMKELENEHAQSGGDSQLILSKLLQVTGAQLMLISRIHQQNMLKQKEKEKETEAELRNALKEKEKAETELKVATEAIHEKEKEIMLLKEKVKELEELVEESDVVEIELGGRVEEMEKMVRKQKETTHDKMCEAFIQGFDRAMTQAKFLAPDADFSEAHCLKVVMDGELVEAESSEEEEKEEGEGENSVSK